MMSDESIDSLLKELQPISRRIHALKYILENTNDDKSKKEILEELKKLRRQALFYIERIENLRRQG